MIYFCIMNKSFKQQVVPFQSQRIRKTIYRHEKYFSGFTYYKSGPQDRDFLIIILGWVRLIELIPKVL